jgi:hypothetical protein
MPCNQDCNQGRRCTCAGATPWGGNTSSRATVIVVTLLIVAVVSMGFGVWKLFHATKGQDCQIEVKFKDSTATYIGKTV